jgi:hypothetical protein
MNFAPKLQHNLQYTYKRVDFYVLLVLILKRFDKICTFDGYIVSRNKLTIHCVYRNKAHSKTWQKNKTIGFSFLY